MKLSLVLMVALSLVFSTAMLAIAADNQWNVYGDFGISGSSSSTSTGTSLAGKQTFNGTSGWLIGGEYDFNPFKVVVEYTGNSFKNTDLFNGSVDTGTSDSDYNFNANVTMAKFGYRFVNNNQFNLDVVAGYLGLNVSGMSSTIAPGLGVPYSDDDYTIGGPMIGIDGSWKLSDKFSLAFSYGGTFGATESCKIFDTDFPVTASSHSSSLTAWRIKGIYLINDNWGAYVSYSSLESILNYSYPTLGSYKVDSTWTGTALGATYKF